MSRSTSPASALLLRGRRRHGLAASPRVTWLVARAPRARRRRAAAPHGDRRGPGRRPAAALALGARHRGRRGRLAGRRASTRASGAWRRCCGVAGVRRARRARRVARASRPRRRRAVPAARVPRGAAPGRAPRRPATPRGDASTRPSGGRRAPRGASPRAPRGRLGRRADLGARARPAAAAGRRGVRNEDSVVRRRALRRGAPAAHGRRRRPRRSAGWRLRPAVVAEGAAPRQPDEQQPPLIDGARARAWPSSPPGPQSRSATRIPRSSSATGARERSLLRTDRDGTVRSPPTAAGSGCGRRGRGRNGASAEGRATCAKIPRLRTGAGTARRSLGAACRRPGDR